MFASIIKAITLYVTKYMSTPFSTKISEALVFSRKIAKQTNSSVITPEHILFGILKTSDEHLFSLFDALKIDLSQIKKELKKVILTNDLSDSIDSNTPKEPILNESSNNILRLSVLEARLSHQTFVDIQHMFLAILHDNEQSSAKMILQNYNLNYKDASDFFRKQTQKEIKDNIDFPDEGEFSAKEENSHKISSAQTSEGRTTSKTPVLDNFCSDLTSAASKGLLDPVIGRTEEINRIMEILCRRKKNNPILIGEPGVGKSAIVEGLAQLIVSHETPPMLYEKRVVCLDLTSLVAGTKYRGQFEERIRRLIEELEKNKNIIIFIDEIHTIIGAGNNSGTMDAANILKPALAKGTIQCIGATTLDEFRNSIEKDGALERRFQKIIVDPTTKEETLKILHNIKNRYEEHHHVLYNDKVLSLCVQLSDRYITDRFFPDKAIDILDETGARVQLKHVQIPKEILNIQKEIESLKQNKQIAVQNQNFELAASYRDRQTSLLKLLEEQKENWIKNEPETREKVSEEDVEAVVSKISGIPVRKMQLSDGQQMIDIARKLKSNIIAQDNAIDTVVKSILRNKMGLKGANRPIGAFMFLGPTGVGKTFLAKKLAEYFFGTKESLIRIDMSEYNEGFNASRLIGAPPGYVGYEEGGQLTERVRRHPYSVVLLDEIEKAHSSIFNLLLQVLDEGRMTDGNGRLIDFSNTIIIMTSNVGTRQLKDFGQGVGFTAENNNNLITKANKEHTNSIIEKSLKQQFSPEFLNRLDEVVIFEQLDIEAIKQIIALELKTLETRVSEMGYQLQISEKAKELVALKGYDVQYGARPLKRAIQTYIEDGICQLLLSKEVSAGTTINIGKDPHKDALTFKIQ